MPVSLTKTWEYIINEVVIPGASYSDKNQRAMLRLKQMLTETGGLQTVDASNANISMSSPFVVVASSDSVTADATDNWAAASDLVWDAESSAHSWIHLRQTDYFASGDHLHLLISLGPTVSVNQLAYVAWCRGATGWNNDGTTTTRPTLNAAAQLLTRDGSTVSGDAITSAQMWGLDSGTNTQVVIHFRISDDGQAGGWFVCRGGTVVASHGWQRSEEDQARTNDFWVWALGLDNNGEVLDWTTSFNSLRVMNSLTDGDVAFNAYVACPCYGTSELPITQQNHGGTGNRLLTQAVFVDDTTSSLHGLLTDMWWNSDQNSTGDGSPTTPPVIRRTVGEFTIPWPSGGTMQVA